MIQELGDKVVKTAQDVALDALSRHGGERADCTLTVDFDGKDLLQCSFKVVRGVTADGQLTTGAF